MLHVIGTNQCFDVLAVVSLGLSVRVLVEDVLLGFVQGLVFVLADIALVTSCTLAMRAPAIWLVRLIAVVSEPLLSLELLVALGAGKEVGFSCEDHLSS